MKKYIKKTVIIIIFIVLIVVIKFTPVGSYINLTTLFDRKDELLKLVSGNLLLASLLFTALYILTVALSIPGATLLTIMGGFLFGPLFALLFINIGATTGALIIFMISRYIAGNSIQLKYKTQLEKFNRELNQNGTNYLLTLRLIPIFPFFLINILSGLTTIPWRKFVWTTAVGIIPGSFIYAYIGYAGTTIDPSKGLLTKEIVIALVLLGLLSLIPVLIKKVRLVGPKQPRSK